MKFKVLTSRIAAVLLIGSVVLAATDRPAGWSDQSYYLAMRDGTRIALSLYFPDGLEPDGHAPVLLVQTRYGRARMLEYGKPWLAAGYVLAAVDTRGSTASFGPRDAEISEPEIADMDEIIAHLASRPWSTGQVVASGVSYMADTADIASSRPAPALVAAIPRQVDFDAYLHLFFPGGVENSYMLNAWGEATRELDLGRDGRGGPLDCRTRLEDCAALFPGLQPVDGDDSFTLLREALNGRRRWSPEDYATTDFRDDPGRNGHALFALSPAAQLAGIRRQAKPVQVWGSWMDAGTAEAALARFRSAPGVPMEIWITANDHNHRVGADPFHPDRAAPIPDVAEQARLNIAFADHVRAGKMPERRIHYYVLGAGIMKTTSTWPPTGVAFKPFSLDAHMKLSQSEAQRGFDRYKVDFTASTGAQTRWSTNFGVPPRYPDRRNEDRKLLRYDSAPMAADTELAGSVLVMLRMRSLSRDPAIYAYLEDVAPDGRVTYLTEGQLRLIHRKPARAADLPYDQGAAPHSFSRKDALEVVPGQLMDVRFTLFPVAAKIAKGHRIRVAFGGADAGTFKRLPVEGPEQFEIVRGGANASRVMIPLKPWSD